jgi:hypothetical protein
VWDAHSSTSDRSLIHDASMVGRFPPRTKGVIPPICRAARDCTLGAPAG